MNSEISTEELHKEFISKICQTGKVWALEYNDEFASADSEEYEDEEGNPAEMICFWSEESKAQECINKEWKNYKIEVISLSEFIENWCIGMSNDQLLIGSDFTKQRIGHESDPLEVILEINEECLLKKFNIKLENYSSLVTLAKEIRKVLITEE